MFFPQFWQSTLVTGASVFSMPSVVCSASTHQPAISDAPSNDAPSIAFGSDRQREDLGRVQPRHRQPCCAERESEEEDHARRRDTIASRCRRVPSSVCVEAEPREAAAEEHRDSLDNRAPVQRVASADPVECENADERGEM